MTADRLEPDDMRPRQARWPSAQDDAPTDPHLPVVPGPMPRPVYQQPPDPVYQQPPDPVYQQPPDPVYQQPPDPVYQQRPDPRIAPPARQPGQAPPLGRPGRHTEGRPLPPRPEPSRPASPRPAGQEVASLQSAGPPGTGRTLNQVPEADRARNGGLPRHLSDIASWRPVSRHGELLAGPGPRPDPDDPGPVTQPLPAIDLADFEASSAVNREPDIAAIQPSLADQAGLASVARGGTLNLAGALIAAVSTLGVTIAVTRQKDFGPPVAGAFFTAMSLFLIVEAIANLGAYNGAIYFIARYRALHAERRIPAVLRATLVPVIFASLTAAVILVLFARPLALLLLRGHPVGVNVGQVVDAVRAMAVALPFAAMTDTFLGASRGYRSMRPTVVVDRIGRSALQLLGVLTAALSASALLLAPLWAFPYLPACLVAYVWFRRVRRRNSPQAGSVADQAPGGEDAADSRHGKPNARGFWRFTAPRSLASTAQIIIQRLDIVLVATFLGFKQAAIYTAATRFLVAGQLGNVAIVMAAQPQFTHLFALRDMRGANAIYQVTTAWLVLLTWPLYLLVIVFGPAVLDIFGHGGEYRTSSAITTMIILALAMLVSAVCGQVDMVLITTGRSSWSLANGLLAMVVNVTVDVALIPRYGIEGAAIGWAAAIVLSNLMPLIQVGLAYRLHPFGRETAAACLLAAVSFGLVPWAVHSLTKPLHVVGQVPPAIAALAAGCAVMTAGLWLLRGALQLSVMPGFAHIFGRPIGRSG